MKTDKLHVRTRARPKHLTREQRKAVWKVGTEANAGAGWESKRDIGVMQDPRWWDRE